MMKRVTIHKHEVALVYRNGVYQRMMAPGHHWLLYLNEKMVRYSTLQAFIPPQDLNVYLQDPKLADALIVVEVKDTEIVLQYENGLAEKSTDRRQVRLLEKRYPVCIRADQYQRSRNRRGDRPECTAP